MNITHPERLALLRSLTPPLRLRYTPITPTPKQHAFLTLKNKEVFFGGSAGPGKSWGLLMAALQFVDVPGYAALILRKSFADLSLPGALMAIAQEWLGGTDAKWHDATHTWSFPGGGTLTFGYLEGPRDRYRYQSAAFSCVARGTMIRMGDGTVMPIEQIHPGMEVATLIGPRRVTAARCVGQRPSVYVETSSGWDIISANHRVLVAPDVWASPLEVRPIRLPQDDAVHAASTEYSRGFAPPVASLHGDHSPSVQVRRGDGSATALLDYDASQANSRTGCAASDDSPLAAPPLPEWCVRVVLVGRGPHQYRRAYSDDAQHYALVNARCASSPRGSKGGSSSGRDYGDERSHPIGAVAQTGIPSLVDAAAPSRGQLMDGWGNTRGRTRSPRPTLVHPYTREAMAVSEAFHTSSARMVPVDAQEVWDLTVEGANHYELASSGMISQNCICFDELTHFRESDYTYLFSRCRRPKGALKGLALDGMGIHQVPLRVRSASNPGGVGHLWVHGRFIDDETRRPGAVFMPAKLTDNPHLDYDAYVEMLAELGSVDRRRLLEGDWEASDEGAVFKREWFTRGDDPTCGRTIRYWDTAATEVSDSNKDPDFTVGVLMGRRADGKFVIKDVRRAQLSPGKTDDLILETTQNDGHAVEVWIQREPGSASKILHYHYAKLLPGYTVKEHPVGRTDGDKQTRAKPWAAALENGLVEYLPGHWIHEYISEHAGFPSRIHDDQVDASAGAHYILCRREGGVRRSQSPVGVSRIPRQVDRISR